MERVHGKEKSIKEVLQARKYGLDYYQREFNWATKQVEELIRDLSARFLDSYDLSKGRKGVEKYGHYFLGSIILSSKDGKEYIVDGQQRLTTLTLFLIFLNNLQREQGREDTVTLDNLIFSEQFGNRSFNIDVPERNPVMDKLFSGQGLNGDQLPPSLANISARYDDITALFPDEFKEEALPYFIDWLIECVDVVQITAYSDDDAYTIFETMNDRGLPLSPTDMLKGYLLANISSDDAKTTATQQWRETTSPLREGDKSDESDFFKAWLRSQHAASIRERKRNASPRDWDRIGTEFHRWVRDKDESIGLTSDAAFTDFISRDMSFYGGHYRRLLAASKTLTEGLEYFYYLSELGFTWQNTVALAPLAVGDDLPTALAKMNAVGAFLDALLVRRIWNFRSIAYSNLEYAVFRHIEAIRRKPLSELVEVLTERLAAEEDEFVDNRFYVHQQNNRLIRYMLARMTDHVERRSGITPRFVEYMTSRGVHYYEVEHIWADKFDRHRDEFSHPADFAEYRNRIGDLLLLPKQFNASFGADTYHKKVKKYYGQNILAQSLNEEAYSNSPGFLAYVRDSELPFEPYADFDKEQVDKRQELYRLLASEVWSPAVIVAAALPRQQEAG